MKGILCFAFTLVFFFAVSPVNSEEKGRTLKEIYQSGVEKYNAGQYEAAMVEFQTFLKHEPTNPYGQNYAAKCRQKIREGVKPVQTLEGQLTGLVIPEINFEATELGMAMEFLTQKSEELSGGKVVANFIYKGTEDQKKAKTVTLKLRNAPFVDVVRYLGQLTQTRFTYEQFAIVGTPLGQGGVTTTPAPATSNEAPAASKLTPIPPPSNADPFGKR